MTEFDKFIIEHGDVIWLSVMGAFIAIAEIIRRFVPGAHWQKGDKDFLKKMEEETREMSARFTWDPSLRPNHTDD